MLGSLQRLIDDVSCSANALVGRRVAAANGAADRQVTRSDRFQTLLVDTLKGDGAQISWTDEALRQHALGGVNRLFGDDPHWCVQVTLAIRLLDPQSITGVDELSLIHI